MNASATARADHWPSPVDKTSQTDDERIRDVTPLPPPEHLIRFFPIRGTAAERLIGETRQTIRDILHGQDDRLLVIIGPCSIHDPAAAMEYAQRLKALRAQYKDTLEVVMRVYFEKPRTTVGWKGLINDPYLDGSFRIDEGLRIARQLLIEINRLGVPAASEFLDVISPPIRFSVNSVSYKCLENCPISTLFASFWISSFRCAAIAAGSRTGTMNPFFPSNTLSTMAPWSVEMIGSPAAMASTTTQG